MNWLELWRKSWLAAMGVSFIAGAGLAWTLSENLYLQPLRNERDTISKKLEEQESNTEELKKKVDELIQQADTVLLKDYWIRIFEKVTFGADQFSLQILGSLSEDQPTVTSKFDVLVQPPEVDSRPHEFMGVSIPSRVDFKYQDTVYFIHLQSIDVDKRLIQITVVKKLND